MGTVARFESFVLLWEFWNVSLLRTLVPIELPRGNFFDAQCHVLTLRRGMRMGRYVFSPKGESQMKYGRPLKNRTS